MRMNRGVLLEVVGLHKGSVLQIATEDGVADIDNNSLGRFSVLGMRGRVNYQKTDLQVKQGTRATYDNARHMDIQNPLPGIVRPMDLHEVGLEVIRDGFIFVRSFAKRCDAIKLRLCQPVPGD